MRQIADAEWRLQRITRIEAGLTTYKYNDADRYTRQHYPQVVLPGRDGENQLLGKGIEEHTQSLANLARYRTLASRDINRSLKMIRQLRKDEYECKENRAANGAIHRPTLTDPDPYTTPDPMEPQPPRYEPPAAAAQTSNPIGFRAQAHSTQTEARSADLGFEIRGLSCLEDLRDHSGFVHAVSSSLAGPSTPGTVPVHKQTRAPLKTNGLSPAEALRTNYGTRRPPAAPPPSLLATEATRR